MSPNAIIERALELDVVLFLKEGGLAYRTTAGKGVPAALREDIVANKDAIIAYLAALQPAAATLPPIAPRAAADDAPLSYAQQQLLLTDRLGEGSQQYNIQGVFRAEGALDVRALQKAVSRIVERHQILRTNIVELDGIFFQFVQATFDVPFRSVDLSMLDAQAREDALADLVREDALAPFDLERDPMLRMQVVRIAERTHVLIFCFHHIASDGWSLGVFIEELKRFLAQQAAEGAGASPPLQYVDYAAWQRALLEGPARARAVEYWTAALAGIPDVHTLPMDRARPATQDVAAVRVEQRIDMRTLASMQAFCKARGITLFMFLQSVFALLLHRASGHSDIVMGTPMSGRTDVALEPLIGLFINTVVLRNRFASGESFDEHLQRMRERILSAHEFQYLPFELVVEELNPLRSNAHHPIFQVWFVLQNNAKVATELPGCIIHADQTGQVDSAKHELNLYVTEDAAGLAVAWVARAALFDPLTISSFADAFASLVQDVIADPTLATDAYAPFAHVPAATALDRRGETVDTTPLLQRLLRQVAARPDAAAVVTDDLSLTYAELDRRSDALAGVLAAAPQGRIGLCLGHSAEMVVAIWGCIKAGRPYVPLDAVYPTARLSYILADACIGCVLHNPHTAAVAAGLAPAALIDIASIPQEPGVAHATGAEEAYVLYTSGSTGTPKGVVQSHAHVALYVSCYVQRLRIDASDRILQLASFGHDAAVLDMFAALSQGACLHLVDLKRHGPEAVTAAVEQGATIYHSTPSVFKFLFAARGERLPDRLRAVVFGGEAADAAALHLAQRLLPAHCTVTNLYGSSEATLVSMREAPASRAVADCRDIGGVMPGMRLYPLREDGRPAGLFEPAELVVESDALALAYLNLSELTARCFTTAEDGGRAYRTGDLAFLRPDGTLRYLGRRDNQFKLHGQRIAPEEIEAAIGGVVGVRAAAAVLAQDGQGHDVIAACVVRASDAPAWETLQQAIGRQVADALPTYMVPTVLLELPDLPRTASGKIDRRGLAGMTVAAATTDEDIAPRTQLERELAAIWSDVLGVAEIGVEANFFALGGNSFKSLQIISAVARRLSVQLSLRDFFDAPTIAGCARCIDARRAASRPTVAAAPLVADHGGRHDPFPLTPIQQAYWLGRSGAFALGNVATQGYVEHDVPAYDHARMVAALQAVIDRHDMLRAVITESGEQRVLPSVPAYTIPVRDYNARPRSELDLHLKRLRADMSSQVRSVHVWPIFDFRVTLLPGGVGRLHVCTDAIILDARSRAILVDELMRLYADPALALPPLAITFRDYVLAEAQHRKGEVFARAQQYWRDRLETLPPAPELPLALDPSRLETPVFVRRNQRFDRRVWDQLRACATGLQVTPLCLLMTAFADILAYWGSRSDFTVNVTLFNRMPLHEDVNRLIGDFTSSNLLQMQVAPGSTFADRARAVQTRLLDDIDHRAYSGVDVLRQLVTRNGTAGAALMPVVFTGLVGSHGEIERQTRAYELVDSESSTIGATQTSQVYLDCQVYDADDSIAVTWNTVDALFFPGVVDAMFTAYVEWVSSIALDEQARTTPVLALLPAGQQAVIDASNATEVPRPSRLLHDLFLDQVQACADAPAVIAEEVVLSYDRLDRESSLLAYTLSAHGVGVGDHVAVLMRKGWEQVVAVIAILKAGAAYLPIDADLPADRVAHLVAQTQARVVLVQRDHIVALHPALHVEAVLLHPPAVLAACERWSRPTLQTPADLAYTIFTSGSTGVPKGVMIDHAGAVNTILDINARFDVGPHDRVFGISELNFDLSVYDIFGTLAAGAALVIPAARHTRDPQAWTALLARHSVTIWNSVPALAKLLFDEVERAAAELSLRVVMMSGDWIPLDLPPQIRAALPDAVIQSLGGATEASIWSVGYRIDAVDPDWRSVPYGTALENQSMHVLNPAGQPCPAWVRGDLYIGGIGLAMGYHGDPELTAASFITDAAGRRLYRTGDLARWMGDGNLEFLGRLDSQVKINGYRIELGEIESHLIGLDGIAEAVAVATGDRDARRLVAYVVPAAKDALATPQWQPDVLAERLDSALRRVLPGYMVPEAFVALPAIPLTGNGKVDRRSLPDPDIATTRHEPVAPATRLETEIAAVWSGLLGKDGFGVTDNFFALGGNSIVAVRAITAIREKYRLSGDAFQFNDFFAAATVRSVAAIVERLLQRADEDDTAVLGDADAVESGLI
ncbi:MULTISPECIES: non-ribosomal peptide synthetase [unclassified Xanthomonas]|uniref:non-ribosomal peptide synthetase n=1 Tax=unclassified Xanthomonas TaxID=2643310 RepID=UPI002A8026EA|nr:MULTISPECIES: non-ribosomal peptide synthetase [unclassified Xanthomonas]MDY4296954.1 amino acid adenylation domain-containing protein [Xanthomonas sp. LF02-5]MDY4358287.1 amino acid adenylation domain-containing protein [Xanthomonas sp. LF04-12]